MEGGGDPVPKEEPLLLPLEHTVALPPPPEEKDAEDDTEGVEEATGVEVVAFLMEGVAGDVREREREGVEVPQAVPRATVGVNEAEPLPPPLPAAAPDEAVLAGDKEGRLVLEMVKVVMMVGEVLETLVLVAAPLPLLVPLPRPLPLPAPLVVPAEDTVKQVVEEMDPVVDPVLTPEPLLKGEEVPLEVGRVESVEMAVEVKVGLDVRVPKRCVNVSTGLPLEVVDPVVSGVGVLRALKVLLAPPPPPLVLTEGKGEGEVEVDTVLTPFNPPVVYVPMGEAVGGWDRVGEKEWEVVGVRSLEPVIPPLPLFPALLDTRGEEVAEGLGVLEAVVAVEEEGLGEGEAVE